MNGIPDISQQVPPYLQNKLVFPDRRKRVLILVFPHRPYDRFLFMIFLSLVLLDRLISLSFYNKKIVPRAPPRGSDVSLPVSKIDVEPTLYIGLVFDTFQFLPYYSLI